VRVAWKSKVGSVQRGASPMLLGFLHLKRPIHHLPPNNTATDLAPAHTPGAGRAQQLAAG